MRNLGRDNRLRQELERAGVKATIAALDVTRLEQIKPEQIKEVIPHAGDAQRVADKIVRIMLCEKSKRHYIIGKDAKFAVLCQWAGLMPLKCRVILLDALSQ